MLVPMSLAEVVYFKIPGRDFFMSKIALKAEVQLRGDSLQMHGHFKLSRLGKLPKDSTLSQMLNLT